MEAGVQTKDNNLASLKKRIKFYPRLI